MCRNMIYETMVATAAAACVLLLSGQGRAETRFVSLDGSDEYPYLTPETAARSIQAAVDAAEPGDTIQVSAGEYLEQIQLKQGVCLRGAGPQLTTIERPFPAAYYVIRGAQDVRVQDLSVIHRGPAMESPHGAILLVDAPNQVVDNCSVSGPFHCGIHCLGPVVGAPAVIVRSSVSGARVGVHCPGFAVLDRCTLEGNRFGVYTADADVLISGCTFLGNDIGVYPCYTPLTVQSTRFIGGEAAIGQDEDYYVDLTMLTSVVSGAKSAFVLLDRGQLTLVNSTFADNDAVFDVGMETIELVNCICWGNNMLMRYLPCSERLTSRYSDIQGGWDGEGNIDADPRFMDPAAGDYRLRPDSPCIDAGIHSGVPEAARDLEGKRVPAYGGHYLEGCPFPDMGAYEYYMCLIVRDEVGGLPSLTWTSFRGTTYSIFFSDDLITWHLADGRVIADYEYATSWTDDRTLSGVPPSLAPRRFYRILENP